MNSVPKTTLFLTTYNWHEALSLCLNSIFKQTILPNEIIIADDGSKKSTKDVIDNFRSTSSIPIIHCWQEDKGFRLNKIRNKAIASANFPYIIQIDGDVILDPHFIEDHLIFAKENRFLAGRRLQIPQKTSSKLIESNNHIFSKGIRNKAIAFFHQILLYNTKDVRGVRGCNMSYWKKDALSINGYDEEWLGKGPDDKEFAIRLVHSGIKIFNLKFFAKQYHLYHGEEGLLENYSKNQEKYKTTIANKVIKCTNGIEKIKA